MYFLMVFVVVFFVVFGDSFCFYEFVLVFKFIVLCLFFCFVRNSKL